MFPGKESPWSVLGLESASATARDIKRAYAALLKKHRPDADPEGFRRVHDAYQAVLHELELRDNPNAARPAVEPVLSYDTPATAPQEAAPAPPSAPLPAPFTAAAEKLRAMRDHDSFDGAGEVLAQLRMVCGADTALWREWSRLLTGTFPSISQSGIAAHLPLEDLLAELRAGSDAVAGQVLDGWCKVRNIPAMTAAGKSMTARGSEREFDHPACGRFALRLAYQLGMAQPGGANLLLDAAFRWLTPQMRAQLLPRVESRLQNARFFWHVPAVWQPFWESVFDDLDAGRTPDWDGANARRALQDLQRTTPADWPGWGFLRAQLPMRQWDDMVSYFNSRPASRRGWTAPPEKAWINQPGENQRPAPVAGEESGTWTVPGQAAMEMKAGGGTRPVPSRGSPKEDELWNIPDAPVRPPSRPISDQDRARPLRSPESAAGETPQSSRRRRSSSQPGHPRMTVSYGGRYSSQGRTSNPHTARNIGCLIFIIIKVLVIIIKLASQR